MEKIVRYNSLDGMRIIAAIFVAQLHVGMPLGITDNLLSDVARMAVPFFFMCSGFFIFSFDCDEMNARINKGIVKSIKLLIVSTIIYFIIELVLWQDWNSIYDKLHAFLTYDVWFFNSTPFMPVGWYLSAYIYSILIIRIIINFVPKPSGLWYVIIIICFTYWMVTGAYQHVFFDNSSFSLKYGCCWIVALPWVLIGMVISYFIKYKKLRFVLESSKYLYILFLLGIVLCWAEHGIIKHYTGMPLIASGYLGTIISTISLFAILLININVCRGGGNSEDRKKIFYVRLSLPRCI